MKTLPAIRVFLTIAVVASAAFLGSLAWKRYMDSPWTRDGRVRAEIVHIAPDVSGRVVDIKVTDNQFVQRGDPLFLIEPDSYQFALQQAEAATENARQEWMLKQAEFVRRNKLGSHSVVSTEEWQSAQFSAEAAKAAYQHAAAARDMAKLNLARTVIRATANGFITNLHLRVGDYALTGETKVSIVDSDSFWVAGYFEETKIPRIHELDRVNIELMGVSTPLAGHVETISRGIADANSGDDSKSLANVDPVFTWVRLAQRIPVRIHIDHVPPGVRIVSGMTCTLVVHPGERILTMPPEGDHRFAQAEAK